MIESMHWSKEKSRQCQESFAHFVAVRVPIYDVQPFVYAVPCIASRISLSCLYCWSTCILHDHINHLKVAQTHVSAIHVEGHVFRIILQ